MPWIHPDLFRAGPGTVSTYPARPRFDDDDYADRFDEDLPGADSSDDDEIELTDDALEEADPLDEGEDELQV